MEPQKVEKNYAQWYYDKVVLSLEAYPFLYCALGFNKVNDRFIMPLQKSTLFRPIKSKHLNIYDRVQTLRRRENI